MEYFVVIDGTRQGPFSTLQVRQRLREGEITPDTKVWRRGMDNWLPLAKVDALVALVTELADDRAAGRLTDGDPSADAEGGDDSGSDAARATRADAADEPAGEPGYRRSTGRDRDDHADDQTAATAGRARLGPAADEPAPPRDRQREGEATPDHRPDRLERRAPGKPPEGDQSPLSAGSGGDDGGSGSSGPPVAGKTPPPVPITPAEAHANLPREARAVLRFLARMVDFGLVSMVISAYVYFRVDNPVEWLQQAENARLLVLLLPACAIGYELVWVALIGSTPGKLFFGMRLMDVERRPLTPGQATRRALGVWTAGMGLGIWILPLLLPLLWWFRFRLTGVVPWDQWSGLVVVHRPPSRGRLIAGMVVILLLVWQTLAALAMQLGGG